MIAEEAERLARIVNDILWTSRIESGTIHVTIESCDPVELVETVVQAARLHAPENISIEVSVPEPVGELAADAD